MTPLKTLAEMEAQRVERVENDGDEMTPEQRKYFNRGVEQGRWLLKRQLRMVLGVPSFEDVGL